MSHLLYPILVDISETAGEHGEYRVRADLPGFTKQQIKVSVDDHTMTISAERSAQQETGRFHIRERPPRRGRVLRLPRDADEDSIRASYRDGTLRIMIDKKVETTGSGSKRVLFIGKDYPFAK